MSQTTFTAACVICDAAAVDCHESKPCCTPCDNSAGCAHIPGMTPEAIAEPPGEHVGHPMTHSNDDEQSNGRHWVECDCGWFGRSHTREASAWAEFEVHKNDEQI